MLGGIVAVVLPNVASVTAIFIGCLLVFASALYVVDAFPTRDGGIARIAIGISDRGTPAAWLLALSGRFSLALGLFIAWPAGLGGLGDRADRRHRPRVLGRADDRRRPEPPAGDRAVNVVIAGGHGKVALRLTHRLRDRGDAVRSLVRNPAHAGEVEAAGGQPVVCDLEHVSEDELARAIAGSDAVVFAAGAGPGSGPERKWTVDTAAR